VGKDRSSCNHSNYTPYDKREYDRHRGVHVKRGWKKCNDCGTTFDEYGPYDD
jgi:hypothetical protein